MQTSYYPEEELRTFGFRALGHNVLISRKASIYKPEAISIANNVRVDDFCILAGGCELSLGNYVHVSSYCGLYAGSGIVLEDFAGLSSRASVYSESDDYSGHSLTNPMVPDKYKPKLQRGRVLLRRHAIVGSNSTILPGVVLGEGVAIGAHSLVTKNCEPWWLYFGVPARKLRRRSRSLLELEQSLIASADSDR
jgi:dTDP-4-amino-4,6-dideoxy-D-glucose acyltransferase